MFKKKITYTDYNGQERTEDFYFNLSKSELIMLESSTPGGYTAMLQRIIDSKDNTQLMKIFTDLIKMSYGVKSDDGKHFVKNDQVVEDFLNSAAFDQMFTEFFTDENAAANFAKGIIPQEIDLNRQKSFAAIDKK
jgi:pyruvate/oxaloacetate carboxyltransferase